MKLTKEQIQDLYKFTKQHYVEWYDLQSELVDHLANDIEHILQETPALSYEEAKQKAFKKFGVFGFQDVVEAKYKALRKRYGKIFLHFFIDFFKLPQIVITLSLAVFYFFILKTFYYYALNIAVISLFVIYIFAFYKALKQRRYLKNKTLKTGKKYLFESMTNSLPLFFSLAYLPFQLVKYLNMMSQDNYLIAMSIFVVLFAISMYIVTMLIPKEINTILKKEYPGYQII